MREDTLKIMADAVYHVNEKKRSVTCQINSRGEHIYGVAKCNPDDEWDVNLGKAIASLRAEIKQRKRDLANTGEVIEELKQIIKSHEYQVQHGYLKRSEISRHWDHFLQEAINEQQLQRENIKFCETEIKRLAKNDENVTNGTDKC
jgi:predicted RNase H-like nuclease (RuvC/YqgF family)